jgi:CheY-like chemotaxis protein/HPt (histidine-containing phosphotransfer) domain-containing protein
VKSSKHLLQVINDILDLSKVEANKLDIEIVSVSPFQIVSEIESLVRLHAAAKNIDFGVSYVLPLPLKIQTDPVRLKQIILNLCNNAIKFTSVGHVRLNVSSDLLDQSMVFEVVDTGIGMSEQQIENIFQPFTQADVSTTRKYGGTGLGLSLSQSLVERLGGTIAVKSKPDVGSKFTVHIPIGEIAQVDYVHDESQIPKTSEPVQRGGDVPLLDGHVLAVDDVEPNRRLLSKLLARMGLNVTLAENGMDAIEKASATPFDLILMDIQMPLVDGLEATSRLRAQGVAAPIVALTANALKEDLEGYLATGFNSYVVKPINRRDLYETLARYLPASKAKKPASTPIVSELIHDEVDFSDVVNRFVTSLPSELDKIKRAFSAGDWEQLSVLVHQIKGTSGNMGFPPLMSCAAAAERHIRENRFGALDDDIAEIESVCRRIAGN